jgi:sugar phosphate isomerase/epimerase
MIHTGLVSITFRQLDPEAILSLVRQAGLEAIEWGGDVHVPHGEVHTAHQVRQMTLDAGITIPSYGSYYRVGHSEPAPFPDIVKTAVALGATVIRVWAGKQGSADADEAYWDRVVADSRRIADLAQEAGLVVAYEYHGNTLTDTQASAIKLLKAVDHDAVKCYWQPPGGASVEENLAALDNLLPWLANVHVFSWRTTDEGRERMPLAAMPDAWQRYFEKINSAGGSVHALLEFVRDDTPEQFLKDAATLKGWVEPYQPDLPVTI